MQTFARPNVVRFTALCCLINLVTAFAPQAAATNGASSAALAYTGATNATFSPSLSNVASSFFAGSTSTALAITGAPAKSVNADQAYAFQPTASAAAGKTITFSITNKPAWASFNTSTGMLRGTPSTANVGTYSNVTIKASDGAAAVALPSFAIAVTQLGSKTATLSWAAPTENSNGTPLTNLAGYNIEYGTSRTSLTHKVNVNSVGLTTYVIGNLSSGTYYFAITAYNSSGVQSKLSNIVSVKL